MELAETRDRAALRALFASDPGANLYQWGDLEEPLFGQARWFAARSGEGLSAVLLLYTGTATPVVLCSGEAGAAAHLLDRFTGEMPGRFYTKLDAAWERAFAARFALTEPAALTAMMLGKFHPRPQPPRTTLQLLDERHAAGALPQLLEHYPGNRFEPWQLTHGIYAGAWLRGRLVSAAGTHAWARAEGVAVLGNIVTHADHRGKGLAAATVSFLVRELRRSGCRHIGLHVETANAAAIACYESVGFRRHSELTQYLALARATA